MKSGTKMKRQIRRGVFDSNSSSVHSIALTTQDEFDKWKNGDALYDEYSESLFSKNEVIKTLQREGYQMLDSLDMSDPEIKRMLREEGFNTYEDYMHDERFDTYVEKYTTPKGEKIVAFGKYGYDG